MKQRPFASRSQQGWAFANNMPFARRWAHDTGEVGGKAGKQAYASLTERIKKGKRMKQAAYTTEERKQMAKEGLALPDLSFPIKTKRDLRNAVYSFGRATDKEAAKAHIIKRAKALNALYLLPEAWRKGLSQDILPPTCPTCGQPMGVGVQGPATGKRFLKKDKNETSMLRMKQGRLSPIVQVDPVDWVITTIVQSPDIPHIVELDGEPVEVTWDARAIKQAAWDFLKDQKLTAITMHHSELPDETPDDPLIQGEHGTLVESWIAPCCLDLAKENESQHVPQGTWLISYYVETPTLRQAILNEAVNAVSLTTFEYEAERIVA